MSNLKQALELVAALSEKFDIDLIDRDAAQLAVRFAREIDAGRDIGDRDVTN